MTAGFILAVPLLWFPLPVMTLRCEPKCYKEEKEEGKRRRRGGGRGYIRGGQRREMSN